MRHLGIHVGAWINTLEKIAKTSRTCVYHRPAKMEEHVEITTPQETSHVYVKQVLPEVPVA